MRHGEKPCPPAITHVVRARCHPEPAVSRRERDPTLPVHLQCWPHRTPLLQEEHRTISLERASASVRDDISHRSEGGGFEIARAELARGVPKERVLRLRVGRALSCPTILIFPDLPQTRVPHPSPVLGRVGTTVSGEAARQRCIRTHFPKNLSTFSTH